MQMVKKIFIALILVYFALLVFMPKQELYYKLEKQLETQGIKINEKNIKEGIFSLDVENVDIYVKGIRLAEAESLSFFTLLFYSSMTIENLFLDESLKAIAPTEISEASISHVIFNPLHLNMQAEGSFGGAEGSVDLVAKSLHLDFNDSEGIEILKPQLTNGKEGWYYETSF